MFAKKDKRLNMELEIIEQKEVIPQVLEKYVKDGQININLPDIVEKIVIVASGSSYHCARLAVDLIEKITHIETHSVCSSNFIAKSIIPKNANTLYIFITQSGETSDTLKAIERVKTETNLPTLCITNVENSTIWNICDYKMLCYAGIEKGIAATKSLSSQILCLFILTLKLIKNQEERNKHLTSLYKLSNIVEQVLEKRYEVKNIAKKIAGENVIVITGDGLSYSIAKEITLKIKETSYKNISAFILGEFMHGHVAVLNNKKSTLIYTSSEDISERSVNNILDIQKDYSPTVIIIGKNNGIKADYHIEVECDDETGYLFANLIIGQLIALETALKLKRNVDNPKGLHKVVTDKALG